MRVSCRHWSVKIGAVFFYSRKEDKDGKKRQGDLRNLQEMSVTAVDDLMGLKERSREEAFNIIQEWTKEFTEKYGNYYFDGSYYDEIDAFIEEKLRTI